jgi:glycerol uptake facilitator-like aquaporin
VLRDRTRVRGALLRVIDRSLARRATAEAVGSALLVAIVVGSGISAQRLSPNDVGLVALILAFGPVSGAHFNPVVTLVDWLLGGITAYAAAVYAGAQIVGCCIGAVVANLMFELGAVNLSTHTRSSHGLWLGEFVATFGLLLVVFGIARSGRAVLAPFAVGGYIASAYWYTSSTSFANPAVTVARMLSDTFAGIRPSSVPAFLVAQIVAALCAVALVRFLHPGVAAVARASSS